MYLSERIKGLFADKARFERAYRKGYLMKSLEFAVANPLLGIGYHQIMAHFERKLAEAIRDEEESRIIN